MGIALVTCFANTIESAFKFQTFRKMKLPAFNQKAALIATAIGALVVSNVATYKNAYSGGYKTSITESRVGYMEVPAVSGAIVVSQINGKKHHYFEAYPDTPAPDDKGAWNNEKNRKFLEWSIQNNAKIDGDEVRYASAACTPQITANFWSCTMRKLGSTYNENWRVEMDPRNGTWKAG